MSLCNQFMISLFFLLLLKKCHSLSFNLTSFNQNMNDIIHFENDSYASNGDLHLTNNQHDSDLNSSVGRASHVKALHLWENKTGKLTDFTTRFSFTIQSFNNTLYGDGIAFFIAPFRSKLPQNSTGGMLGLRSYEKHNASADPFVAVEFDSFQNSWDPSSDHVGINVNSLVSEASVVWKSSIKDGRRANAWVSYNSTSHNLSVFLTYADNPVFSGNSSLFYIVDLRQILPEKVVVGFSAATGDSVEFHTIHSWSFNSTLIFTAEGKSRVGLVVGIVLGVGACVCGFVLFWFICRRRAARWKEEEYDESIDVEFGDTGPKRFTYRELRRATNGYAEERKLGEGGFGGVYKGFISKSNAEVAVKRISKGSRQGKKEYVSEVNIISRLRHKNLVQLLGWCHTKGEFLLVYEFMPNGSLDTHLFGSQHTLIWTVRYKIAHGLASSLLYLHEEWEQCVVHRDIKSSNVMLDSNFNAKLGDFGLARLADHESGLQTTILAGTMGYMAPECVTTGKASKESDVYSFGVVSLEICCGRRPVERNEDPRKTSIVEWVWDLYGKGKILEAVDERLSLEFDEKEMESLMVIGLWCCHPDPSFRPSIKQVMNVMNFEAPLPNLPSKLPRPMYFVPQLELNSSFYTSSTASGSYFTDSSKSESQSIPLQKFSQNDM